MTPPALLVSAALSRRVRACGATPAAAQGWPNRPISMIATFPAGGPTDGVARVLAHELGERLKQKVVVENRGGAGGTLGAAAVAKSPPDGHTLLLTSTGPLGYYRALYKSLPYDPVKDFAPVGADRHHPAGDHRLAQAEGGDAQGIHRARARQSRQGQYRRLRRRHHAAHPGGADGADDRHRDPARALSRRRRIGRRRHGRADRGGAVGLRADLRDHEGARRHLDRTAQGAAERADVPRERARHRVGALAHAGGAGRHAARRDRAAQRRHQRFPQERARQDLRDQLFAADRRRHAGSRARIPGERRGAARAGDPQGEDHAD